MRNGYALPDQVHLRRIDNHLRSLDEPARDALRGLLRIGFHADVEVTDEGVILPVLTGHDRRTHAAIFSFMAGVTPPIPMLGRSLL